MYLIRYIFMSIIKQYPSIITLAKGKNVGTFLGRAKLFIYQGKGHNLQKSNDPPNFIWLLNKLCSPVLYQCLYKEFI